MRLTKRLGVALAATALFPVAALAADYEPPIYVDEAPEYVPVEVGSGWYLRGDVAWIANKQHKSVDFGTAPDSYSESRTPIFASLGAGYHFNDYLRAELNLGYVSGDKTSLSYDDGTVSANGNLSNRAWTGIVNGYVDLGTYVGLTPYLGAGVGVYRAQRDLDATYTGTGTPPDFSIHDSKTQYSFAYTLNAGVAYQLSKNVQLDVGYQFLSAPNAEYAVVNDLDSYSIRKGVDYHQVKVGLRYDLW